MSLDEMRLVSVAFEELLQLIFGNSREEAGIRDLVPVQMEDRQYAAIARRVDEFIPVPAGGERPGLGFAVTHHAGDNHVGVVECCSIGMAKRVSQLATLVNASRGFRRDMAGNPPREAKLLKQLPHPVGVLADVGIDLAVSALQIGVRDQRGSAVTGTD